LIRSQHFPSIHLNLIKFGGLYPAWMLIFWRLKLV